MNAKKLKDLRAFLEKVINNLLDKPKITDKFASKQTAMIEYIKGKLTALDPTLAIVETAGGVAYALNVSLNTYATIEGKELVQLLVHESIRDDAWVLFGFAGEHERMLFRLLIGVSGVGAGTARIILSAFAPAELETVISTGDTRRLKSVKGIGARTAERIIVDLRDKITVSEGALPFEAAPSHSAAHDEALAAMVALGYPKAAAQKALKKLFETEPALTAEQAIKRALAML